MEDGFGDIDLDVQEVDVKSFKFLLSYQNEMLKSLVNDPLCNNPLSLSYEVNAEAIKFIHRFYSGQEITLDGDNIIGILSFCVCYSEHRLIPSCMKCLSEIVNNQLIIDIFQLIPYLNSPDLSDFEDVLKEILSTKANNLLLSSELKELTIPSVEYMLKIPCLQIDNEEKLFKSLIEYYKNIKEYYNDPNELIEDFNSRIFANINWSKINVEMIDENSPELINEEELLKYIRDSTHPLSNRIYVYDFPEIDDDKQLRELLKDYYYNNPCFALIKDEDMNYLHNENIRLLLKKYLKYRNIRFKISCLLLIAHTKDDINRMNIYNIYYLFIL